MKREEELNEAWCKYRGKCSTEIMQALAFALRWCDEHPNWISVEDELPRDFKIVEDGFFAGKYEQTDIVMVALDDGDFGFARYVHDFPDAEDGEGWYWVGESTLSGVTLAEGEVTHWMPTPQPPKKENK